MRKKRITGIIASMFLIVQAVAGPFTAAAEAPNNQAGSIISEFKEPGNSSMGMFRYWLPDAAISREVVETQLNSIYEAGFGGIEIAHVPYSRREGDLANNGWGTPAWQQALITIYEVASEMPGEFQVDVTINTQWPPALDTIDPNDDAASQELHMTYEKIMTGQNIYELILPETKLTIDSGESFIFVDTLEAATVARVQDVNEDGVVLDYDSLQDVSEYVTQLNKTTPAGIPDPEDAYCIGIYEDEEIDLDISTWGSRAVMQNEQHYYEINLGGVVEETYISSPDEDIQKGDLVLYSFYRRGTGETINPTGIWGVTFGVTGKSFAETGVVLDEFSQTGAEALTDYWDEYILNDRLIALMKDQGGNFFEDSIETVSSTMFWNPTMLESFQTYLSYDAAKYLPFLFCEINGISSSLGNEMDFVDDLYLVQSERYLYEHIDTFQTWAKETTGSGLRTQSYSHEGNLDEGLAAAIVDVAEGETIEFGKNYDRFRTVSGGVHTAGKNIVSDETLASGSPYSLTWKKAVSILNGEFAAGVNRIIIHGYPYANTENMNNSENGDRDHWPGWTAFASVAGAWGERQTYWDSIDIFSDYINRTQAVLQNGTPKYDVAVMTLAFDDHTSLDGASEGQNEKDLSYYTALLNKGFNYEVLTEGVINLDSCTVTNNILNEDGSAYKALIIDNLDKLGLDTAEKLLVMAKAGLPVVFAGTLPQKVSGTTQEATGSISGSDQQLQEYIAQAMKLDNVLQVSNMDELFVWLDEQEIAPLASYDQDMVRNKMHQDEDGTNYYYIYNGNDEDIKLEIELTGTGVPYKLDAWTGEITPIANYQPTANGIALSLDIENGNAFFIAVTENTEEFGQAAPVAVRSSEAEIISNGNALYLRTDKAGVFKTELSNGQIITETIDELPVLTIPTEWNLSLESWGPDSEANITDLTVSKKTVVEFAENTLGYWSDLKATSAQLAMLGVDEMSDIVGIGTYSAQIQLSEDWSEEYGYYMEFDHNNDMITNIYVNGNTIHAINQVTDRVDIGSYLNPGKNNITIELSTTMLNRILYEQPGSLYDMMGSKSEFGLEEVRLMPYVQKVIYISVDTSQLQDLIARAEKYQKDDYVEDGAWTVFEEMLNNAKAILEKELVDQDEIDEAVQKLEQAMENLKKKADKTKLEQALAKAERIDPKEYTEDSYAVLEQEVKAGWAMMNDLLLSTEDEPEIEAMAERIEKAISGLVKKDAAGQGTEETQQTEESKQTSASDKSTDDTRKSSSSGKSKSTPKTGDSQSAVLFIMLAAGSIYLLKMLQKKVKK